MTRTFRLVVERELRESFRRRAIWVTGVLLLLASTALVVVPRLIDTTDTDDVAVVADDGGAFAATLRQVADAAGSEVDVTTAPDVDAARAAVAGGDADAAAVLDRSPPLVITESVDSEIVAVLRQAVSVAALDRALTEAGVAPEEVADLLTGNEAAIEELDPVDTSRQGVASVATIVLYILLLLLTTMVASGVAIEKSNRVSEVLLAIVPTRSLLFGKVVGIALIGMFGLACGALPVTVSLLAGASMPDGTTATLLGSAVWFALGIALYLTTGGALGALVDRQEEVGSSIAPLSAVAIGAYLVGVAAPESALATVLAYIPFTSPMVMPARLALGAASVVEIVVSVALGVVAVVLIARLAAVVYRRAIVRTGQKLRLRDVLAARA